MIGRRAFLGSVALGVLATPRPGHAGALASGRVPRVGVLGEVNPLAWVVKTPVAQIECRWSEAGRASLAELASELVGSDVDVVVALGAAATRAARHRTARIPIVAVADDQLGEDAVVAEVARSARNVTWLTAPSEAGMARGRLRLLASLVPRLGRVAVLFNPDNAGNTHTLGRLSDVAAAPDLVPCPARSVEEIDRALSATPERADGLLVLPDALFSIHAASLVRMAANVRLPAVYAAPLFVEVGGLAALYGDTAEIIRHTVMLVRRTLEGRPPAAPRPHVRPRIAANAVAARRLAVVLPSALRLSRDA